MKAASIIAFLGCCFALMLAAVARGQVYHSGVSIVTVYSADETHYLRSVPYDHEYPTLRGRTEVFRTGSAKPVYAMDQSIEIWNDPRHVAISDDGRVIAYLLSYDPPDDAPGLMAVNIYRDGRFVKGFSTKELTGKDRSENRNLLFVDWELNRKRTSGESFEYADDRQRFLAEHSVFEAAGRFSFIDFELNVHSIDLNSGTYAGKVPFEEVFETIKGRPEKRRSNWENVDPPYFESLPELKGGKDVKAELGRFLGMKPVTPHSEDSEKYKSYKLTIGGLISRGGNFEVESVEIENGAGIDQNQVRAFFELRKFDDSGLPEEFDKWYLGEEGILLRNSDDDLARKEKEIEVEAEKKRFEERQKADTIDGRYIPADLGESMLELDKILTEADKAEFRSLPNRDETIKYHFGLGMWLRNNWHLWGGSRLQKYFFDLGVFHPDDMSGIILEHYYEWLKGDTGSWKTWEEARREELRKAKENESRKQ
ncbi:MAG: hypothetical protein J5I65_11220 [Aridibacter famidurans]|nr:hypothetical protein [Aridibacter famidurans]